MINPSNKSSIIKILDLASFIGLLLLISSGVVMRYTLPPRSRGETNWNLTRHEWGDLHYYISIVFLVLMALHLLLHIKYIKHALLGRASRENSYRVAGGAFGLAILLFIVFFPIIFPIR